MGNVPAEACIALGKGLSDMYCAQDLLHEINALHTDHKRHSQSCSSWLPKIPEKQCRLHDMSWLTVPFRSCFGAHMRCHVATCGQRILFVKLYGIESELVNVC